MINLSVAFCLLYVFPSLETSKIFKNTKNDSLRKKVLCRSMTERLGILTIIMSVDGFFFAFIKIIKTNFTAFSFKSVINWQYRLPTLYFI